MENDILKAIELLKAGKVGKVSKNIFTVANAVVFRDVRDCGISGFLPVQEIIAIKTNSGVILGNSSRMQQLEDQRFKKIIQPARIQRILSDVITMIPFTVFTEAGLDLLSCEILDNGPAEILKENLTKEWNHLNNGHDDIRGKTVERHFTGARLFKAHTKNNESLVMERYFLVDVDRREVEHNIINFFLAEIPEKVETIKEAYEVLKPKEVKMFEERTGEKVDRQGEFFFIPCHPRFSPQLESEEARGITQIRVGNSRPNYVESGFEIDGKFYVLGTIKHSGREHADLKLGNERYFKVVPNTSKANFQLTGDID